MHKKIQNFENTFICEPKNDSKIKKKNSIRKFICNFKIGEFFLKLFLLNLIHFDLLDNFWLNLINFDPLDNFG